MSWSKYMHLKLRNLPESVVQNYNLEKKTNRDGYVYAEIKRGMYGLPQAGLIAQQLLEKILNKKGYHKNDITPGLWKQKWRPICDSLWVDDFGVKYFGKYHADHLMSVLREYYKIYHNWKGKRHLGIDLDWDYSHHKVNL